MSQPADAVANGTGNPCRSCGACCGYFRILLDWTETADFAAGGIPLALTVPHGGQLRVMAVTAEPGDARSVRSRCVALDGEIGRHTTCRIHDRRPKLCREFDPLVDGAVNPGCDEARAAWGLPPLDRRQVTAQAGDESDLAAPADA